jgi:hypothetical protein
MPANAAADEVPEVIQTFALRRASRRAGRSI